LSDKKTVSLIVGGVQEEPLFIQQIRQYFIVLNRRVEELYTESDERFVAAVLLIETDADIKSAYEILSNPKGLFFCILASNDSFEQCIPMQTFKRVSCVLPYEADIKTKYEGIQKAIECAKNKNTEKNMNELIEKQMKYALMGEMLSSITHQLRQPINAVSAEMIRLKISGFLGEVDNDFLNVLMDNVSVQTQKMSKTITEFLSYFSPAKQKDYFMLGELIDEVVSLHKELLNRLNISFESNVPKELEIYGSKSSLLEIIVNFISNSKDAYEVKEQESGKKKILLKAEDMGSFVSVSVEDFAGGVAPEHLDKVLSAYFTTKSPEKGTGLGLHISKKIIESEFAGSISAQNSENGFLVTINIPKINSRLTI
jgi:signal transduction histidine kinase